MNGTKLIIWVFISLIIVNSVVAIDLISDEDMKDVKGALGNVGYYFATIVNWIVYGWLVLMYWFLIILYFLIIYFFMVWLPLRLFPTFVQYYNMFRKIFGIDTGQSGGL